MSALTPAQPALGWTPQRRRRANLFITALVAAALAAALFSTAPWFAWATSGQPVCTPAASAARVDVRAPAAGTKVSGIYAAGCLTGTGIAEAFAPATGTERAQMAALNGLGAQPTPDVMFGLPRTAVLLLVALALGVFGVGSRNGFLTGAGFVLTYYAHRDLGSLSEFMLGGTGGSLTVPESGLNHFGIALLSGWVLLTASTVFVVRINADQRALDTVAALRDGTPAPLSPVDHATSFIGNRLAKLVDSVADARTHDGAKSHEAH